MPLCPLISPLMQVYDFKVVVVEANSTREKKRVVQSIVHGMLSLRRADKKR